MSAYEGSGVRVWDRDGQYIVIEIANPYQQPRLVLTITEARDVFGFLKEYFGKEG